MKKTEYKVIICAVCNKEQKFCVSSMPILGLCTCCRKKQWRKDNPEMKQPNKHCKQCGTIIGKNGNLGLCKGCRKETQKDYLRTYNNTYTVIRYKNDINFRLAKQLRSRISHAIRESNVRVRVGSAVKDLGCTVEELRLYLESKFKPGMTWDNYGKWHIDHIKPLAKFDLSDTKQFKKVCFYKNLQPLWAKENLIKSDNIVNP